MKTRNHFIAAKLNKREKAKYERYCQQEKISMSDLIRTAVRDFLFQEKTETATKKISHQGEAA
jgi:hypothetical protein